MEHKSIKKNTIFSMLKTGSSILFPLITFPYVSRVLLAENLGKVNFGQSIISYFSLIASLGITTYAIRECSGVKEDKKKLVKVASQIFSINIMTTVIAYFALALTLIISQKLDGYKHLIILQSMTIIFTTIGADWLNSAMEDFRYMALRTMGFQFLSLVLMFTFVHRPEDYMKYAAIILLSSAGANIMNFWYRRKYCSLSFTFSTDWKRHMKPILLLFVMILAQNIFNNVDSTMLGFMCGDREVGLYSAAHKMSNLISQMVTSILWVIMPRMSYYFSKGDYEKINLLLRKVLGFHSALGLPCAMGTIMLADDIVYIMAGIDFLEAGMILRILMLGFVFTLFGGSFLGNSMLLPAGRETPFMITCCITAIVNMITNYFLIPIWGAKGAAITTAFCSFIILIILLFTIDKKIKLQKCGNMIITPLIGCIGIVGCCVICSSISMIEIRTIVSVAASVIIYGIIMLMGRNELFLSVLNSLMLKLKRG